MIDAMSGTTQDAMENLRGVSIGTEGYPIQGIFLAVSFLVVDSRQLAGNNGFLRRRRRAIAHEG